MAQEIKIDPKTKKFGVFGITGSGKTYFVENALIHHFKRPFVYLTHREDFQNCGANVTTYIPTKYVGMKKVIDKSPEHLDKVMGWFISEAKKGNFDAFILDEASTILPKNYEALKKYPNIIDAVDSHRHYGNEKNNGFAIVFMGRRPQAICTEITGNLHYMALFMTEGAEVKQKMREIDPAIVELMPSLSLTLHNFILKEAGHVPTLCDAFRVDVLN